MTAVALTIAGSDPSGGAGVQADLKTFHQHGVYGMAVVTLLTVQNTQAVKRVEVVDPLLVGEQLETVLEDIPPCAAKTGALGNAAVITAVAVQAAHFKFPLVVDPVMVSKHGAPLLDEAAARILQKALLPHAFLVTPNLPEAAILANMEVRDLASMEEAAAGILEHGAKNVLVKGGHLEGEAVDVLLTEGRVYRIAAPRIQSNNTHGTGCVFSAAITARLARGADLLTAVRAAKAFVTEAIRTSPGLGGGCGPINLHAPLPGTQR